MSECEDQGIFYRLSDVAVSGAGGVRACARSTKVQEGRGSVKLPDKFDYLHNDVEISRVGENTIVDYGISPWISAVDIDRSTALEAHRLHLQK